MATVKKGGLGRGLDALFADVPVKEPAAEKNQNEKKLKEENAKKIVSFVDEVLKNYTKRKKRY